MSSINPVLAAAATALAAACTSPAGPDHTENDGSQATAIPAIAHTTGEKPEAPAGEASQPASDPAHRLIEAPAGAGARAAPYLATLKSPVAVISLRSSRDGVAGWIEVSKTQQTLISDGGDSGGPWFFTREPPPRSRGRHPHCGEWRLRAERHLPIYADRLYRRSRDVGEHEQAVSQRRRAKKRGQSRARLSPFLTCAPLRRCR